MQSSPGAEREAHGADAESRSEVGSGDHGPQPDGTAAGGDERDELANEERCARLVHALEQLETAEERFLRARADLDNYRRRAEREIERRVREQTDELIRGWLEVVDSVERALTLEREHPRLADGLRAFLDQMNGVLARQGVTRFGEAGEPFDPERHEAVAVVSTSDQPEGAVAEVARSGYSIGDRVLRAAQVAVSRPPDQS
jgi:molecular chaperone GrpE